MATRRAPTPRRRCISWSRPTFGPTALEVSAVQAIGPRRWIDQQLPVPESPIPDGLDGNAVRSQVFLNMATGPDQLRQRAMFAPQPDHRRVGQQGEQRRRTDRTWVRLLSRNAFGNFRTLLRDVSLSPTMGKYLDNVYNRKATATTSPNENYARELLQLFSIGTWQLNNDGSAEARRRRASRSRATARRRWPTSPARSPGWTYPADAGGHHGQLEPRVLRRRAWCRRPTRRGTTPAPRRC